MDKLIKAVALLIEKLDINDLSEEERATLLAVSALATEPVSINHTIRAGYEKYLIERMGTLYNLRDWTAYVMNIFLSDADIADILDTDYDILHGNFLKVCNGIINTHKI